jgi:hypothetical protein
VRLVRYIFDKKYFLKAPTIYSSSSFTRLTFYSYCQQPPAMPESPSQVVSDIHREDMDIAANTRKYGPDDMIKRAEPGRMYLQVPHGDALRLYKNVLFPAGYHFPRKNQMWDCPVQNCAMATENIKGLGNHWRVSLSPLNDTLKSSISDISSARLLWNAEQAQYPSLQGQWGRLADCDWLMRSLHGRRASKSSARK